MTILVGNCYRVSFNAQLNRWEHIKEEDIPCGSILESRIDEGMIFKDEWGNFYLLEQFSGSN